MRNLFFFDAMLTPKIITLVYWLLLLAAVTSGIDTALSGYGKPHISSVLSGLAVIVVGAIGARIWCELLIVLFKIHENLKKLADKTSINDEQGA